MLVVSTDVVRSLKTTVTAEGAQGLWRGLGSTLYRDVPFSGIYWAIYESLKSYNEVTVPTFWFSFIGGATSGSVSCRLSPISLVYCNSAWISAIVPPGIRIIQMFRFCISTRFYRYVASLLWQVAAFITAPFDVVKTHKQIEFGEKVLYASEPVKSLPQTDTVAALQRIFRTSGIKGLFAGVLPRVIKVAPACAIMITSFEYGKAVFFKHNVKNHLERHGTIQWREWWWLWWSCYMERSEFTLLNIYLVVFQLKTGAIEKAWLYQQI